MDQKGFQVKYHNRWFNYHIEYDVENQIEEEGILHYTNHFWLILTIIVDTPAPLSILDILKGHENRPKRKIDPKKFNK